MGSTLSLIPELEDIVQRGSPAKRREILQRMTALFLDGASRYNDAHVDLFDDVFSLLIEEIESKARAELSRHLAPLSNAPVNVLRTLANDDDISVAEPVLKLSPRLAETDLLDIASTKGQDHLRAISGRRVLGEAVTDVLVRRGDREVARSVAENRGARISQKSFSNLVQRAENDGVLAEAVASRPDIPLSTFRALLEQATAVVHGRLIASATPQMRASIRRRARQGLQGSRGARWPARLSRGAAGRAWSQPGQQAERVNAARILRRTQIRGGRGDAGCAHQNPDRNC